MKSLKKIIATACAGMGVTAVVLVTGLPASASTLGDGGHGNSEWISGFLAGPGATANAPVVPLQLQGAVNTYGSINLGGNSSTSAIGTNRGTLTVEHGNPNPAQQLNSWTCRETETINTWFKVAGSQSSGVFWSAHGGGNAVVAFSAIAPRYTSGPNQGKCNFSENAQPEPWGAWISFHAQGMLYLRHHR